MTPWERRDYLARSFRQGRVLIAGDAAHEMSPTGGSGMHAGICEAVNLAWKLQALYDGWGGSRLLESYEAECRPVASQFLELSTTTFDALSSLPGATEFREAVAADSTLLWSLSAPEQFRAQFCYEESPICITDGTEPPEGDARLLPSARPGTRAPHCWIADGRSTFDLFGDGFVLIRFAFRDHDVEPLVAAASERGVPLEVVDLDHADAAAIYEHSLVLVRPDGHVAWRGDLLPGDVVSLVDHVRGA